MDDTATGEPAAPEAPSDRPGAVLPGSGRPAVPPVPYAEGRVVLDDGRDLGYAEFGRPDGDVVVWFHGTPGARKQLPPEAPEEATRRGQRIIVVERPGTGWSTPHPYRRVVDVVPDVRQLLDRFGIERFAAAGLSGGGPFALAMAHEMPDQVVGAAVLGGVGPTRGSERAPGYTQVLIPLGPLLGVVKAPLATVLSGALGTLVRLPVKERLFDLYRLVAPRPDRPLLDRPEFRDMFLQDLVDALDNGIGACVLDLFLFSQDWGFRLRDIQVPVRFWHGDADLIVPFSHGLLQSELVHDSRLVTVPDGGHFSGFETVPLVLDAIRELWHPGGPSSSPVPPG